MQVDMKKTMEIITPKDKIKVEIKDYITGEEYEQIEDSLIDAQERKVSAKVRIRDAMNKTIELIVISIDGNQDDKINKIKKMKLSDYNFVLDKVNLIKNGLSEEKKTELPNK